MKLRKVVIPTKDLKIGDIIRLPLELLKESIMEEFLVLDITSQENNYIIKFIINNTSNARARVMELHLTEFTCPELASWEQRVALPIYAKDLEVGDMISPFGDEHGAQIVRIRDDYSRATRHITYQFEKPIASFAKSAIPATTQVTSHITALFSDMFYTPTRYLPSPIRTSLPKCSPAAIQLHEAYLRNISLLLESFSVLDDKTVCSFKLGARCTHNAIYTNGKRSLCAACMRKIAVVAAYGDVGIILEYNRKIQKEATSVA